MRTVTPPKPHYTSLKDTYSPQTVFPEATLRSSVDEVTKDLVAFIETIDDRIGLIDTVLEIAQPLETGAIRVEWRTKKHSTLRIPRLVEWRRHKGTGLWSYVDVKHTRLSLKAKYAGNFLEHHHRVVDCLTDLDYLLTRRNRAVEMLRLYRLHAKSLMDKNNDAVLGVMIRMMTHNVALKPAREERERWMKANPPEKREKKTVTRRGKGNKTEPEFIETVTPIDDDEERMDDDEQS